MIMNYVLWNDHCSDCQFIVNAFSFLQMPLSQFELSDTTITLFDSPKNSVLLVCKHSFMNHEEVMNEFALANALSIIVLAAKKKVKPTCSASYIQYLEIPCCQTKLNELLANCTNYHATQIQHFPEDEHPALKKLVGQSSLITNIKKTIRLVAKSDSTVLIQGQSGTGKDVIANCIHQLSNRSKYPFVPINCGAIPAELIESELFGYEKGAFTGATARRAGRFEMAQGGTLFLDEIGEMPFSMQVKLLRVLQERKIERIGGGASIDINIRVIAATNKSLESLIHEKLFREDLFYRLNVFPIIVPSLADRRDDIPVLIDYYLEKIYERIEHKTFFTDAAKALLSSYSWPGNIRELQNFLERMVILYSDSVIDDHILVPFIETQLKKMAPLDSLGNANSCLV
jgi:sigma-54 specific flagellar transcriptional regulator A